jgi:hypothetical protein
MMGYLVLFNRILRSRLILGGCRDSNFGPRLPPPWAIVGTGLAKLARCRGVESSVLVVFHEAL